MIQDSCYREIEAFLYFWEVAENVTSTVMHWDQVYPSPGDPYSHPQFARRIRWFHEAEHWDKRITAVMNGD